MLASFALAGQEMLLAPLKKLSTVLQLWRNFRHSARDFAMDFGRDFARHSQATLKSIRKGEGIQLHKYFVDWRSREHNMCNSVLFLTYIFCSRALITFRFVTDIFSLTLHGIWYIWIVFVKFQDSVDDTGLFK